MKRLGTYTYKRYTGHVQHRSGRMNPTFELLTMRVEIVEETQRKYRVKYLGFHASGAAVNSLHWVGKGKVKVDGESPADEAALSKIKEPAAEHWLPYKDD